MLRESVCCCSLDMIRYKIIRVSVIAFKSTTVKRLMLHCCCFQHDVRCHYMIGVIVLFCYIFALGVFFSSADFFYKCKVAVVYCGVV